MAWADALIDIQSIQSSVEKVEIATNTNSILPDKNVVIISTLRDLIDRIKALHLKATEQRELSVSEKGFYDYERLKSAPDVTTILTKDINGKFVSVKLESVRLGISATKTVNGTIIVDVAQIGE